MTAPSKRPSPPHASASRRLFFPPRLTRSSEPCQSVDEKLPCWKLIDLCFYS